LQGFFELLDLADWDFVINLSAYDWPVRSTQDIYDSLIKHGDSSWIEYWRDPDSILLLFLLLGSAGRLTRPHITLAEYKGPIHSKVTGLRWWPFPTFHAYKQHQWMILSRSFIEYCQSSSQVFNLLAYMEHTWIPDESFFAIGTHFI
jgi:hypothetical protein